MKENKIIIILTAILAVIVIGAMIFFGVSSMNRNKAKKENQQGTVNPEDVVKPTIELSLDTTEEDQEKVTITIIAETEDEEGIDHIVLPNNTQLQTSTNKYTVKENGEYTFKAVGVNGGETSKTIEVTNIKQISADNPYIPAGFEHIGGEPDTGYVIQDTFGNQYVWVPVESGILTRSNAMNTDYEESNSTATALVNSVAKNYGFYIARFEASSYEQDGRKVGASMAERMPWTDLNFRDAETAAVDAAEVFGYENAATALINSYAWDTTLEWINQSVANYSTNTSYGNYSGTIYPTGSTESDQMNYICDLAGNVREWTTEQYNQIEGATKKSKTTKKKDSETATQNRVVRGGSANLNKIASSRNGYSEELADEYWGFRMVLYANT